jgi:hypothetical protein
MTTLTLHGELGRKLVIGVHGFERETAEDPYDANWLRCSAEVEQGRLRGNVDASFTTNDFARFLSEMDRLMTGESAAASFNTMEEALAFRIEVDRAGRATVVGKLREVEAGGAELSFNFESDLSFLTKTHSDLKGIVAAFPHRTAGT